MGFTESENENPNKRGKDIYWTDDINAELPIVVQDINKDTIQLRTVPDIFLKIA